MCGGDFGIHRGCDRGQAYCGAICRTKGRQRTSRAARRRHRETAEGRADHRDWQRAYRRRRRVVDHGSQNLTTSANQPGDPNGSNTRRTVDHRTQAEIGWAADRHKIERADRNDRRSQRFCAFRASAEPVDRPSSSDCVVCGGSLREPRLVRGVGIGPVRSRDARGPPRDAVLKGKTRCQSKTTTRGSRSRDRRF
jgi:hypothetical protein